MPKAIMADARVMEADANTRNVTVAVDIGFEFAWEAGDPAVLVTGIDADGLAMLLSGRGTVRSVEIIGIGGLKQ